MPADQSCFFDTNILLYLLSEDIDKANRAEELIAAGGTINVQVLNEFVNVSRRKLDLKWVEIHEILLPLRSVLTLADMKIDIHDSGCRIAERYQLAVYDAMIVAAAIDAQCTVLMSEDMHNGLIIVDTLTIVNPFRTELN